MTALTTHRPVNAANPPGWSLAWRVPCAALMGAASLVCFAADDIVAAVGRARRRLAGWLAGMVGGRCTSSFGGFRCALRFGHGGDHASWRSRWPR